MNASVAMDVLVHCHSASHMCFLNMAVIDRKKIIGKDISNKVNVMILY